MVDCLNLVALVQEDLAIVLVHQILFRLPLGEDPTRYGGAGPNLVGPNSRASPDRNSRMRALVAESIARLWKRGAQNR